MRNTQQNPMENERETQWDVLVICADIETAQRVGDIFVPVVPASSWAEALAQAKLSFEHLAGMTMEQFGIVRVFVKDTGIYPC